MYFNKIWEILFDRIILLVPLIQISCHHNICFQDCNRYSFLQTYLS